MTDDESFVVDRHPDHNNILIAGGCSGIGFKFGPSVGKIIARLVLGNEGPNIEDIDINAALPFFSLGRKMDGFKCNI